MAYLSLYMYILCSYKMQDLTTIASYIYNIYMSFWSFGISGECFLYQVEDLCYM